VSGLARKFALSAVIITIIMLAGAHLWRAW
jgi:hypothetical protein